MHLFHSDALDLDLLTACWVRLCLKLFRPFEVGQRLVLLADGIKAPKEGKRMPGVKMLHQQSASNTKPEYIMGHSLQAISLLVHSAAGQVRAHIFLCMLAYYVEWHMRQAWAPLMFTDEDQAAKLVRDPVTPATRSDAAMKKVLSLTLDDGSPVHSYPTLMAQLQTIVRNTCRTPGSAADVPTFEIITTPNHTQKRALDLIDQIKP